MDLQLSNKNAVIFGAARGLGLAIAKLFADEGANVGLVDIAPAVEESAMRLSGRGVRAVSQVADVTDYESVQKCIERLRSNLDSIDHVIYAVGIGSGKFGFPFWNLEPSDWDRVLKINLIGAVNVAHVIGPSMASDRKGTMLFLSSVAGQIGSQTDPPYSAAKAGLINFAQCVAKDLAPYGVRVNTLCPGMVQTDLNRSVWQAWADRQPVGERQTYEEWAGEKIRKVVPLNRWQTPEDVAAMAVFLSSECARNITGQTINVDGGFVMHW